MLMWLQRMWVTRPQIGTNRPQATTDTHKWRDNSNRKASPRFQCKRLLFGPMLRDLGSMCNSYSALWSGCTFKHSKHLYSASPGTSAIRQVGCSQRQRINCHSSSTSNILPSSVDSSVSASRTLSDVVSPNSLWHASAYTWRRINKLVSATRCIPLDMASRCRYAEFKGCFNTRVWVVKQTFGYEWARLHSGCLRFFLEVLGAPPRRGSANFDLCYFLKYVFSNLIC